MTKFRSLEFFAVARGLLAKLANKVWMFRTVIPWSQTFQICIPPSDSSGSTISGKKKTLPEHIVQMQSLFSARDFVLFFSCKALGFQCLYQV